MSLGPTMVQAARAALSEAMADDESIVVFGEDVATGGPFGLTKQLAERHGAERVRNTPISEGAVMGTAIGLALGRGRAFVDLMFNDFLTAAADQLFNHAAKIHFMSGGRYAVPLTVWTTAGGGTRWGAQHSQRLDGWLTQVPGLKVLVPSTPAMAELSLRAALAEPNPVVVLADRELLLKRDELLPAEADPWRPRRVSVGDAVSVLATGRLTHLACEAATQTGVSADILDLQCAAPLDLAPVLESLDRTGRLVVAHDESALGGIATALAARIGEAGFWLLDGPITRVTARPTPVPAAPGLEDAYAVGPEELATALREAVGK